MCVICVELIKQKMTLLEAGRNLDELTDDPKASKELLRHRIRLKNAIDRVDTNSLDKEIEKGRKEMEKL